MSGFRRFVDEKLVEVLLVVVVTVAGALIAQRVALAVAETRIENLEARIEQLRSENRDDHKQIMDLLKSK